MKLNPLGEVSSQEPDGLILAFELVLTTVLVVVISMTLEIPEMAVSAYMVFFIQREDPVTTALTGVGGMSAITVGLALSVVAYRFTFEYPAARVAVEGWISLEKTQELFQACGRDFQSLKQAAAKRDFRPVPLGCKTQSWSLAPV